MAANKVGFVTLGYSGMAANKLGFVTTAEGQIRTLIM